MTALIVTSIVVGLLLGFAAVGVPLLVARPWVPEPDFTEARRYLAAKAARRPAVTVPGPRAAAEATTPAKATAGR